MNPQEPQNDRMEHSIEGMGEGEQKLCEIRKHPFGIIMLYFQAGIGLLAALGLMYFLLPQFVTGDNGAQLNKVLWLVGISAIGIILIVLFFASVVYHQSYLIMTTKNVTQVLQQSLFKRQVSELSLANVEDVTAHQDGILATIFNFGKLVVETAGEQNNFVFNYCPKPNYYGKILLDARQRYIESDPVQAVRANRRLNPPSQISPPSYQEPQAPPPTDTPSPSDPTST